MAAKIQTLVGLILAVLCGAASAQTFNSSAGGAIGDAPSAGIQNTIVVSGVSGYPRMRVTLNITHGDCDNLDIFLLPPGIQWPGGVVTTASEAAAISAGAIELSTDNLGSGDNFTATQFVFRGDNNFDPGATAASITTALAPATGQFAPEGQNLFGSAIYFNGANGSWRLAIVDDSAGETGMLNSWSIEFGVPPSGEASLADLSQYSTSSEIVNDGTYVLPYARAIGVSGAVGLYWINHGSSALSAATTFTSNFVNCTASPSTSMVVPASQAPGTSTYIVISVVPSSLGAFSFRFNVPNGDSNEATYAITISGTALSGNTPEVQVERPAGAVLVDGGTDFVGTTSIGTPIALTYVVRDRAPVNLSINTPMAAPAALVNCSATITTQPPASVVGGSSSGFVITITPAAAGDWSFTWAMINTDPDENPYNMAVTGTAAAPVISPECDVSRGAAIVDGGTDVLTNASVGIAANLNYVIANSASGGSLTISAPVTGLATINCSAVVITQPAAAVTGGTSTNLVVEVTPITAGAFSCSISFGNSDANENPYNWTVNGVAAVPPRPECDIRRGLITIADGSIDALGPLAASVAQTVSYTIENTGNAGLILNGAPNLVVVTPGANVFSALVSGQPTSSVGAAGATVFDVTFTVAAAGAFDLQLTIANNDGDENPYNWTISGNGTTAPEIVVSRNDIVLADGAIADEGYNVAGLPVTLTYMIANIGNAPLSIATPVTISGARNCSVVVTTQPHAVVAAGTSTTLVITAAPRAIEAFSFTISIANDDANENPYNWTVRGVGTSIGGTTGGTDGGNCSTSNGTHAMLLMLATLGSLALLRVRRPMRCAKLTRVCADDAKTRACITLFRAQTTRSLA